MLDFLSVQPSRAMMLQSAVKKISQRHRWTPFMREAEARECRRRSRQPASFLRLRRAPPAAIHHPVWRGFLLAEFASNAQQRLLAIAAPRHGRPSRHLAPHRGEALASAKRSRRMRARVREPRQGGWPWR